MTSYLTGELRTGTPWRQIWRHFSVISRLELRLRRLDPCRVPHPFTTPTPHPTLKLKNVYTPFTNKYFKGGAKWIKYLFLQLLVTPGDVNHFGFNPRFLILSIGYFQQHGGLFTVELDFLKNRAQLETRFLCNLWNVCCFSDKSGCCHSFRSC